MSVVLMVGRQEHVPTTQSDLQIECNLYQNPIDILCRNKSNLKIHMKS
jgi:hypothetical protein